ncbi:hypothetical protein [Gimesia panareensis]|uniref:hypothetical protein n=1 Tax=Gimesia panareensis TaxID=2527978 RepID=UPI001187A4E4|nr:hypothetical protein [Gimesia panareensis]QDU51790.1 hypothetical protein Pan110_41590 [Gimesia panareensis]
MILRLTVILMLFSMLSHTLLGCGWHHAHDAHAGHAGACQPVAVCDHGAEHAHDHHTDHAHAAEHQEEHPAPQHSDPCHEGRCSYLTAASVKVHEDSPQLVSLLPVWDLLCSAQEKQYVNQMREQIPAFLFSAPGVRAQAQTTVWLI